MDTNTFLALCNVQCYCYIHACIGDTPTMMELLKFKGRTQVLKIPREIGTATTEFGIHLLQDKTGARVCSILESNQHRTEKANQQLLMEWVQGRGKMPVSWKTLVSVLDSAELHSLAQQIREVKL